MTAGGGILHGEYHEDVFNRQGAGSFVMSTREETEQIYRDLEDGKSGIWTIGHRICR
jgi:redox-sensitive bicupin YhaK (pirin superfamily)